MNDKFISAATKKNWEKLGVQMKDIPMRLSKRANKKFSTKNIIPLECLSNIKNEELLINIVNKAKLFSVEEVIYNLSLNYLITEQLVTLNNNKPATQNKYLLEILKNFKQTIIQELLEIPLPHDEQDFLGIIYQSLLYEGEKNLKGSYYTPDKILESVTKNLKATDLFLDPCCGSGIFLLKAADKIENPNNIFGCDIDKIACFIAKINMIIKFKNIIFNPKIYNIDFLLNLKDFQTIKFNVIATNPPWGALTNKKIKNLYPEIESFESFSYFIYATEQLIAPNGNSTFILPKSILNVKRHKDIRKFILKNYHINIIENLGKIFSGVLSDTILMNLTKSPSTKTKIINKKTYYINQKYFCENINYNFSLISNNEAKLLNKIFAQKYYTLTRSIWAMGIVTGNNKKFVKSKKIKNSEPVFTGKEIIKYRLKNPKHYISFDKTKFQQVAKEEYYRASEKLIYKFISKKLVFTYDNTSSLVLNSANILIPRVETHSIKTVMAFLNSELFQFLYSTLFDDIKILQTNLCALPFPPINLKSKEKIENLVNNYLKSNLINYLEEIEEIVYESYNLTDNDILLIKRYLNENNQ